MRKYIPYIVSAIIAIQALNPPFGLSLELTNSPLWFTWAYSLCGFLTFLFLYSKASAWLKIFIPYLFINSFVSRCPHHSMTAFIGVIVCAYFYLLCIEIEDWEPIFKTLLCLLVIESIMFIFQYSWIDTLLNFGHKNIMRPEMVNGAVQFKALTNFGDNHIGCFGTIGSFMQLKSLVIILVALLIQKIKWMEKHPYIILSAIIPFALFYSISHKCWHFFGYARGAVWLETIRLSFHQIIHYSYNWDRCLVGFGLGTFKSLFPIFGQGKFILEGTWMNVHNSWLQMLFETGWAGFGLYVAYTISLLLKCRKALLIGAVLVGYTLMFQYPDRNSSTVPLLILFCALIERNKYGRDKTSLS